MTHMDTSPLQALTTNWPGHNLTNTVAGRLSTLIGGQTVPGQSVYIRQLVLEPIGMQYLAQFASSNNMTYAQYATYDATVISEHPPAWYGPRTPYTTPMPVHEI